MNNGGISVTNIFQRDVFLGGAFNRGSCKPFRPNEENSYRRHHHANLATHHYSDQPRLVFDQRYNSGDFSYDQGVIDHVMQQIHVGADYPAVVGQRDGCLRRQIQPHVSKSFVNLLLCVAKQTLKPVRAVFRQGRTMECQCEKHCQRECLTHRWAIMQRLGELAVKHSAQPGADLADTILAWRIRQVTSNLRSFADIVTKNLPEGATHVTSTLGGVSAEELVAQTGDHLASTPSGLHGVTGRPAGPPLPPQPVPTGGTSTATLIDTRFERSPARPPWKPASGDGGTYLVGQAAAHCRVALVSHGLARVSHQPVVGGRRKTAQRLTRDCAGNSPRRTWLARLPFSKDAVKGPTQCSYKGNEVTRRRALS